MVVVVVLLAVRGLDDEVRVEVGRCQVYHHWAARTHDGVAVGELPGRERAVTGRERARLDAAARRGGGRRASVDRERVGAGLLRPVARHQDLPVPRLGGDDVEAGARHVAVTVVVVVLRAVRVLDDEVRVEVRGRHLDGDALADPEAERDAVEELARRERLVAGRQGPRLGAARTASRGHRGRPPRGGRQRERVPARLANGVARHKDADGPGLVVDERDTGSGRVAVRAVVVLLLGARRRDHDDVRVEVLGRERRLDGLPRLRVDEVLVAELAAVEGPVPRTEAAGVRLRRGGGTDEAEDEEEKAPEHGREGVGSESYTPRTDSPPTRWLRRRRSPRSLPARARECGPHQCPRT